MKTEVNVKLPDGHTQVCVWPKTLLEESDIGEFEQFFLDEFGTRAKYLETLVTMPDMENGHNVQGTGGRSDVFFSIHNEDVAKFAVPRLGYEIKWVEDFIDNGGDTIHPLRIKKYKTW